VQKPHRVRAAYAAAIGFLVVSIGFIFFVLPGSPPDSGNTEVRKDAAPSTGSEAGSVAVPSDRTKREPSASIRGRTPGPPGEDRNAQGTRTKKRETVGSRMSAEKARQTPAERSRRDREASGREASAEDTGRGTSAVSGEPASAGTQDVESGKVIDFLIKKRSEQK
jgi:hypothetical protein